MLLRLVTRLTAGIVIALAPDGHSPRTGEISCFQRRRIVGSPPCGWDCLRSTAGATIVSPTRMFAQQEIKTDELTRKPKTKVSPVYPELAKRMSITGTVRLSVVVSANGQVKNAKAIGGPNPGHRCDGCNEAMAIRARRGRKLGGRGVQVSASVMDRRVTRKSKGSAASRKGGAGDGGIA